MLKKIYSLILMCVMVFIPVISVQAKMPDVPCKYEKISESDLKAIMQNEDGILQDINAVLDAEQIEVMKSEHLNIEDAVKIYIDTDIFSLKDSSYQNIKKVLDAGDYVYTCTVAMEDVRLEVTLAVGEAFSEADLKDFTEEEKNQLAERAGKWCVSSVSVLQEGDVCCTDALKEKDLSAYDTVLVAGSLAGFRYPVAVGFQDGSAADVITLSEQTLYEIEDYLPQTMASETNQGVYNYEMVSEIVSEQGLNGKSGQAGLQGGGTASQTENAKVPIIPIAAAVIVVCAAAAVIGFRYKKRNV